MSALVQVRVTAPFSIWARLRLLFCRWQLIHVDVQVDDPVNVESARVQAWPCPRMIGEYHNDTAEIVLPDGARTLKN